MSLLHVLASLFCFYSYSVISPKHHQFQSKALSSSSLSSSTANTKSSINNNLNNNNNNPNLSDAIPNKSSLFNTQKSQTNSSSTSTPVLPKISHGKPNLAPKPPPQLSLAVNNNSNVNNDNSNDVSRKSVARHQSMKSPRYTLIVVCMITHLSVIMELCI